MFLKKINLQNFRNYINEEIIFSDSINYIIGDNAQGKTNLLEAIFFVINGESFKTGTEEELFNYNQDKKHAKIELIIKHNNRKYIACVNKNDKRKEFTINNIKKKFASNVIKTILFTPDDLQIIKEGPQKRRTFLDNEIKIIFSNYKDILRKYNKILVQKNHLLKNRPDLSLLQVFNSQLAETGTEIINYRLSYLEKITPIARDVYSKISDNKEILSISYKPSFNFKNYYNELESNKNEEVSRKQSLTGIHRDDIIFYINNEVVKNFASQGQLRSVVLALKIAELQYLKSFHQYYPVLLLDDVFSELDTNRKNMLISILNDYKIQSFITLTNKEILNNRTTDNSNFILIKNGYWITN